MKKREKLIAIMISSALIVGLLCNIPSVKASDNEYGLSNPAIKTENIPSTETTTEISSSTEITTTETEVPISSGDAGNLFDYIENEDGTITITKYNGEEETVVFPSEIDGKKVSCVGYHSGFLIDNSNTKSVIISEGIVKLEYGYYFCENLETISLPSTLKIIGSDVFSSCYNLSSITLPEGLTSIGDSAFYHCNSIDKLVIPDSVTSIGEDAFKLSFDGRIPIYGNPNSYIKIYADADRYIKFSCINHQNIITDPAITPTCVKNGKTEGSHCADCDMVMIEQQYIPPTGEHTWNNGICMVCQKLNSSNAESVVIPSDKPPIYEIAEIGDIITYSYEAYKVTNSNEKEMTVELTGTKRKVSYITIPNTIKIKGVSYKVTSIAKNAFKNNKTMKSVTIGSNITTIGANAFKGCSKLKTVKVKAKNIKSVGKNAFKGIHAKAKIKVPSSSLKKYKRLLSNKGQKSTVKIIK